MPQNKNLSTAWQEMLGENWIVDRERWLHTMGNLTLTGYNFELGDLPFEDKKKLIEKKKTKMRTLYQDIEDVNHWDAKAIQARAKKLAPIVLELFPIVQPGKKISFSDPRYQEYTCADPSIATFKDVNYYVLLGERVIVGSFAEMVRSVAKKLYERDSSVIERMARTLETFSNWNIPVFSYDESKIHGKVKLQGTEIYISTGFPASDCVSFIKGMLNKYDLDIEQDFVYSAKNNKANTRNADGK